MNEMYKTRLSPQPKVYNSHYRFSDENVTWVSIHFLGVNLEKRGGALIPKPKLQVILSYVADSRHYSGIAQTTVCKTVDHVADTIIQK